MDGRDSLAAARGGKQYPSNRFLLAAACFLLPPSLPPAPLPFPPSRWCVSSFLATVIDHRGKKQLERRRDGFPRAASAGLADRRRRDCRLCRRDSQLSNPICPPERQRPDGQRERKREGKCRKRVGDRRPPIEDRENDEADEVEMDRERASRYPGINSRAPCTVIMIRVRSMSPGFAPGPFTRRKGWGGGGESANQGEQYRLRFDRCTEIQSAVFHLTLFFSLSLSPRWYCLPRPDEDLWDLTGPAAGNLEQFTRSNLSSIENRVPIPESGSVRSVQNPPPEISVSSIPRATGTL